MAALLLAPKLPRLLLLAEPLAPAWSPLLLALVWFP